MDTCMHQHQQAAARGREEEMVRGRWRSAAASIGARELFIASRPESTLYAAREKL
jgi:hypothetical protein